MMAVSPALGACFKRHARFMLACVEVHFSPRSAGDQDVVAPFSVTTQCDLHHMGGRGPHHASCLPVSGCIVVSNTKDRVCNPSVYLAGTGNFPTTGGAI